MTKNLKATHSLIATGQLWKERSSGETWQVYSLSENGMVRMTRTDRAARFKSLQDETLLVEWEMVG
jgi:hypothetical protein